MKKPEQIEEDHIYRLAAGLNKLGLDLDPLENVDHYIGLRKVLETCVSYANEAKKDTKVAEYIGLSDTIVREK